MFIMATTMKELGQALRDKRNEMNASLKEAENATSIRMAHLQALEDGDLENLISPVYAQGFYKQYANFLGLDGERMLREHIELFIKPQKQEFSYGIGTIEMRGNPGAKVKMIPNTVWGAVLVGVVFMAWYAARFFEVI